MRLSESYFFTLRENAADEESQGGNLLVRSGMIKKVAAGIYMMLPMGLRVIRKIERIIREEMEAIDLQELSMPALIPEEYYIASGRRDKIGKSMFALKDRVGRSFVLGPTHEELFAVAGRMEIKSYKDLPFSLYQFQTKFRDEPRPRFGLIRVREFTMKDSYTFDLDNEGLDKAYMAMFEAYKKIFDRMGLNYVIVEADTGVMGGLLSEEFQALSPIGEDILVIDDEGGYASNLEVAACPEPEGLAEALAQAAREETPAEARYSKVYTPEKRTIEEVTAFLEREPLDFVKTLIYNVDGELYAICVRGDREVNENKVLKLLQGHEMLLADEAEVIKATGAKIGFAGPVGIKVPVILDNEVAVMKDFVVGANEDEYHYVDVNLSDFKPAKIADIRNIAEGDPSVKGGKVRFAKGIEVGNTFKLGTAYAEAMDLYYVNEANERIPVSMGSYGIGVPRCMAAAAEQFGHEKGIDWPKAIVPIQVAIVVINSNDELQAEMGEEIYQKLNQAGYDVYLDDRNERAGVKFNDSELVGAYLRITVGKAAKEGKVEVKCREFEDVKLLTPTESLELIKEVFA